MFKRILSVILLFSRIFPIGAAEPVLTDVISFSQARAIILAQNAGLQSAQSQIESAREGVRQAGAFPNPDASLALEKFGANEIEITLGQTIALGGKRRLRIETASLALQENRNSFQSAGTELDAEIVRRFIPIAVFSKKLVSLDAIIQTARTAREQIRVKVAAGALKKTDLIRAEIALEQLAIERSEMVWESGSARKRFAALGGAHNTLLFNVSGILNIDAGVPSLDDLQQALQNSPRFANMELLLSQLETHKNLLAAETIPDLNISAGFIHKNPENIIAPLAGLSLNIPIFNRNAAAQKQVEFQQKAVREKRENTLRLMEAEIERLYGRLQEIHKKITTLQTGILPKAKTVYTLIQEYYQSGSAGYLELASAQSELLRLEMTLSDLEYEWAQGSADLIELTSLDIHIVK